MRTYERRAVQVLERTVLSGRRLRCPHELFVRSIVVQLKASCLCRWPAAWPLADVTRRSVAASLPSMISVSFDAADALVLARFWAAVLGSDVDEDSTIGKAFVEAAGWGGPNIWFSQVPDGKRLGVRT